MKLTKEQITYIDDYLKHHKVKYWDIRIELLDHIVSTIEEKMEQGISFDDAMIEVHKSFGNSMKMLWNTGVEYSIFANGLGFKNLVQTKKKQMNKKYRNLYFKEIFNFLKSFRNSTILGIIFYLNYLLFQNVEYVRFKRINIIVFLIPIIFFVIYSIRNFTIKNKSIHLEYALFYYTFSFSILNMFLQISNPDGLFNVSKEFQIIVVAIIAPLNLVFSYCGLKLYKRTYEKYSKIFKQLQSL
ncbi:hypothetical protein Lupro_08260 [Lutibacter profundi]|uniref:Uncharacterized protein n=1 Tax=Lutibacter profundi TaxID=1622118 RepID=A0A109RNN1_9FLAO|nr:hypothetical protein [Lutibacter profundi]AMC11247.1 hypothetical protein Lupro_08260 [Lutibacter profundi]